MITAELDMQIQDIMGDHSHTPAENARAAVTLIEKSVRKEFNYPIGPMDVPPEWEHRVPILPTRTVVVVPQERRRWWKK